MDTIIRHIIDIDKKANEIIRNTKLRIEESDKEARVNIKRMESEITDEARIKAAELYESTIKEAKDEADSIRISSDEECSAIEDKFLSIKEKLEGEIFYKIIDLNKEYGRE